MRIHAAGFTAAIVPEIGGSLAAFHSGPIDGPKRRDWLRAATADR